MKKYLKIICYLFLITACNKLYQQQNPYFTNFDGLVADGDFTSPLLCSPNSSDYCSNPLYTIDCFYWNGDENYMPKISHFDCINNGSFTLGIGYFCSMFIDSQNNKEKLYGYASGLEIGKTYRIGINQRNLKNELALNDVNTSSDFGSKARFKITFGDDSQYSPIMEYPWAADFAWQYVEFIFQADSESEYFSIEPVAVLESGVSRVITRLAIDVIQIKVLEDEEEAEEEFSPIDEIYVNNRCIDCTSFELSRNEKYIVSGWVKQTDSQINAIQTTNYVDSYMEVEFPNTVNGLFTLYPTGAIIDGWQKMSGTILVPNNATDINIKLKNPSPFTAYFDDIRVHPFNGNLKSFVYDQETQRLMAELDENNYATYYEYDQEGGLVRVKKETEKGVFTIQETRSSTIKKQ
jgi:hypothetical protein